MVARLRRFFRSEPFVYGLLPLLTAAGLALLLPVLDQFAVVDSNSGLLTIAIALGFLVPSLREFLFHVVLFGVAIYAGKNGVSSLVAARDLDWQVRPSDWVGIVQWGLIAVCAFVAGVGESKRPPRDWGRRFYFLAIAAYFLGFATRSSIQGEWLKMATLGILGAVGLYGAVALPLVSQGFRREQKLAEPTSESVVSKPKRNVIIRRY